MATTPPPPPPPPPQAAAERLNVIALISGGKDSFYSLLHCRENGHRVVALANLYPSTAAGTGGTGTGRTSPSSSVSDDAAPPPGPGTTTTTNTTTTTTIPPANQEEEEGEEEDLNSHMYQTVGHSLIPLYAQATNLPLYRKSISPSGATQRGRDYSHYVSTPEEVHERRHDEAESMFYLLKGIKRRHPEANAVCAGAILSTYQRTRVESVAVRLGLTPLAYLWKFPSLPGPASSGGGGGDGQLLLDMEQAGLEARIIKVASGGLEEGDLWVNVASRQGKERVERGMRKYAFGGGLDKGAVIGEGGEFETLVVDGPGGLFKKRIVVEEEGRRVVREGGGTAWLSITGARLEVKEELRHGKIRVPELWDDKFKAILETLTSSDELPIQDLSLGDGETSTEIALPDLSKLQPSTVQHLVFTSIDHPSIKDETTSITTLIEAYLASQSLPSTVILSTTILLRNMSDFATINPIYGELFPFPNPPSRVCISCGDLLPKGINIVIALALSTTPDIQRDGLHVQSRSYWAPANIGPYSQAITTPLFPSSQAKAVRIAGQIPLIPATMTLPPPEDLNTQLVLSLQHLFRIGVETGVQLFTSGVAYFPASENMKEKVRLAAKVWELAHALPKGEDEEEDEDGPDIWDKKYNSAYASFASTGGGQTQSPSGPQLPDWSVVSTKTTIPPVFVAEVEELPRGSGVEWQGHLGVASAGEDSVEVVKRGENVWQVVVEKRFVQTVVVEGVDREVVVEGVAGVVGELEGRGLVPVVTYLDGGFRYRLGEEGKGLVVPCRSLWDGEGGRRVGRVRVWEGVLREE
ncbi:putative ribonuclease [Cercophora samala]|uniref:Diphthine--ammonia ligase n=1 Tax=Cercophora samala TaxID=330535 RepID=A0AA39Z732_9PEZI|nr:putative ribonuclease [Cercophora samala]